MARFNPFRKADQAEPSMRISSKSQHKARARSEGRRNAVVGLAQVSGEPETKKNYPWYVSASLTAAFVAVVSLLFIVAFTVIAWLPFSEYTESMPLDVAGRFWLLSNCISIPLDGGQLSLYPLLLTVGLFFLSYVCAQVAFGRTEGADALGDGGKKAALVVKSTAAFALVYTAIGVVLAALLATISGPVILRLFVLAVLMSFFSFKNAAAWRPLPKVVYDLLRAVAAGLAALLLVSSLAFILAVVGGRERIEMIAEGLGEGGFDSALLALTQLAWLPNVLIWMMSWVTGAGFQFGTDSTISLVETQVGMLPSIPLLGALPAAGGTPPVFNLWLIGPLAAGAVAAFIFVKRSVGIDTLLKAAVYGAIAGLFTSVGVVALGFVSAGDLGGLRLVDIGPKTADLATLAPALLGLGGMICAIGTAAAGGVRQVLPQFLLKRDASTTEPLDDNSDGLEASSSLGLPAERDED